MKIINPLQINDWGIKKFLITILSIQVIVWGLIGLDALNIHIPMLRQFFCFVYLFLVPGFLVLRILRMHNLGNVISTIYAVGLSILCVMFVGFSMNLLYPLLGLQHPISLTPLVITLSLFVLILTFISYIFDKNFSNPSYFTDGEISSKTFLFLCLIPFISIIGTYLMNTYQINFLTMFLILLISFTLFLVVFNKISDTYHSFTIYVISVSLLFLVSLISNYLAGGDIVSEFYISDMVLRDGIWNMHIQFNNKNLNNLSTLLSITDLAPITSIICNINLMWTFKIVFQLIYALVPLGLYELYKEQTHPKIAFLAVFFFMATFTFYGEMTLLARQEIAELFFLLVVLLIIKSSKKNIQTSILVILFSVGIITSHYGLSYLLMLIMMISLPLLYLLKNHHDVLKKLKINLDIMKNTDLKSNNRIITSTIILFFIVFSFFWYNYTSNASVFIVIANLADKISSSLFTDFFNPQFAQGSAIIQGSQKFLMYTISKYLHLISQFLIVFGLFSILFLKFNTKYKTKLNVEYLILAIATLIVLLISIVVPYFSVSMQTSRIYHIAQITLSPFLVLGFIKLMELFSRNRINFDNILKIISVFLVIFFIFNSGFVYEITGQIQDTTTLIAFHPNYNYRVYNSLEFSGAEWASKFIESNNIYSDEYKITLFPLVGKYGRTFSINDETSFYRPNSYIFLGTQNIQTETLYVRYQKGFYSTFKYITDENILTNKQKIYSNNGAEIYLNN